MVLSEFAARVNTRAATRETKRDRLVKKVFTLSAAAESGDDAGA